MSLYLVVIIRYANEIPVLTDTKKNTDQIVFIVFFFYDLLLFSLIIRNRMFEKKY